MENLTKEELIAFEDEIKELYLNAQIKSPVHFSKGNEEQLIEIFKEINPEDWVFSTHRSHYHALLKGIPREKVRQDILDNKSIHLNSREHNFFTSAIVVNSAVPTQAPGQKLYELKYQMAKGTKFTMKSTGEANSVTDQMGTEMIVDLYGDAEDIYVVLSADNGAGLTMEMEFGKRSQIMDSTAGSDSTDFSELLGKKVKFVLLPTGIKPLRILVVAAFRVRTDAKEELDIQFPAVAVNQGRV